MTVNIVSLLPPPPSFFSLLEEQNYWDRRSSSVGPGEKTADEGQFGGAAKPQKRGSPCHGNPADGPGHMNQQVVGLLLTLQLSHLHNLRQLENFKICWFFDYPKAFYFHH